MTNINRYILELYNYMLNLRDTLEYSIEKEHSINVYNGRKAILTDGLGEGFAMGNFLKNNGEKGEELKKGFTDFIYDFYSENSTILKPSDQIVRVDHAQHIKIFTDVVPHVETLKDILFQYLTVAEKNQEAEPFVKELLIVDDRLFRIVYFMLVMKEYRKSFFEFNKVMTESKGVHTPQSNFIVQNELAIMTKLLRDVRGHHRFIDNETLDILDDTLKVVEMTEGRRERTGNKGFKEIFDELNTRLNDSVKNIEAKWRMIYSDILNKIKNEAQIDSQNIKA